jgi:hypothetical protein
MSNKGVLYETEVNRNMKRAKVEKTNFQPAGSDSNAPDAQLTYNKEDYKIEIKLDLNVDFGQGSLEYDLENGKWILGGAKTPAAQQMREFLTAIKVPSLVNKKWGSIGAPRRYTVPTSQFKKKDVDYDYTNFKDFFVKIPKDSVANYYNSKDTYYIQIGGYGLYHMGSDPANLGTKEFDLELKLRVRIKRGGSMPIYNYRFATAIQAVKGTLTKTTDDLDDKEYLKALKTRGGGV